MTRDLEAAPPHRPRAPGWRAGDSGLCAPGSVSRWRRPITIMALQAALLAETSPRPDLDSDTTTEPG